MKKILYVGFRYSHHAQFGGYDWITKNHGTDYLDIMNEPFGSRIFKFGRKILLCFLFLHVFFIHRKYDIVHFFYADTVGIRKKYCKKTKLVATLHLKSADYSQSLIERFQKYDAAVCMSSSEESNLRNLGINAFFIPHGFNHPNFNYTSLGRYGFDSEKINICFPGMNYRDLGTFKKIAEFAHEPLPNVRFHAVGQSSFTDVSDLKKIPNVTVYPFISDDEYYNLIQQCDYCFLPLLFSTANNVLLECQALGTVSILPQIAGISDYADSRNNIFYSDFLSLKEIFKNLSKQDSKSSDLIEFSKNFEWTSIYSKLESFYDSL